MPFLKPAAPALNPLHGFASGLKAAWLFVENTGITVADYSGNNLHLVCTNVTDGSWSVTGATEVSLKFGIGNLKSGATPGAQASLNFGTDTHAWTEIYLFRTRGGSGSKPRMRSRVGNVIDISVGVAAARDVEVFSGSSWIPTGGSSVSGADEAWYFVHGSDSNLKVYKNGAFVNQNVVGPGVANTGAIWLWTAPADVTAEETKGEAVGAFILNRALSANEVASHYSAPFEAWEPAPVNPPITDFTGTPVVGQLPLDVTFTDTSTNVPTGWAWSFGDGGTSGSQSPVHTYAAAGVYTVTLIASNSGGTDTETKVDYITVNTPAHVSPSSYTTILPLHGYEGQYYRDTSSPSHIMDWIGGY